jgi:cystathionine beta-lyase/cystathionine gamma-synthase
MATDSPMGPHTAAIHAGQEPDPTTGAVMQPVYFTSTYRQPGVGTGWPYDYARTINPRAGRWSGRWRRSRVAWTRAASPRDVGHPGGAPAPEVRGSPHRLPERLRGTYRLFEGVYRKFGLDFSWVDTTDLDAIRRAFKPATKMLYVETPANPTLSVTDLRACARLAHARARAWWWTTRSSPGPADADRAGADLVIHSTTKYLNGHSDSVGGAVISTRTEDAETLAYLQNAVGRSCPPWTASSCCEA